MIVVALTASLAIVMHAVALHVAKAHALSVRLNVAGAAFTGVAIASSYAYQHLAYAVLAAACATAAVTDVCCGYVFDAVVLPALGAALLVRTIGGNAGAAIGGAAIAAAVPAALFAVTRGRGIGFGDVKLAGAIGAALGVWPAVTALQVAFVSGGAGALYLLLARRAPRHSSVAFAPYLAAGAFASALLHSGR